MTSTALPLLRRPAPLAARLSFLPPTFSYTRLLPALLTPSPNSLRPAVLPSLALALPAAPTPTAAAAAAAAVVLLDWRRSVAEWLRDAWLRAVPKKKVSHSRKRMRSAHKGLKPERGIVACPACGGPKRSHHLCLYCYADIMLEKGASRRARSGEEDVPALAWRPGTGGVTP